MTPRQFAVLQHVNDLGWATTEQIRDVLGKRADTRSIAMLRVAGLIERNDVGWQLTDAGEAALVAENLRLLKEVADPGRRPRAAPFIIKVPK